MWVHFNGYFMLAVAHKSVSATVKNMVLTLTSFDMYLQVSAELPIGYDQTISTSGLT
jgi:hypothetical protein